MSNYLYDIKAAIIFFPIAAFLVSVPFILLNYHKYGSVNFFKSLVTYSFVLYLLVAYCLIILPLPDKAEVAKLTTPFIQIIPFSFIADTIKNFTPSISYLWSSYVYIPTFNILLTVPFGFYLRYFFKCDLKKTIIFTFLLSLFFELTQLTGLYFIYPRSYRLCDIDDLLQNTFGGYLGYYIGGVIMKFIPSLESVNKEALKNGQTVSGVKRSTSIVLDLFLVSFMFTFISIFKHEKYLLRIMMIVYFVLVPLLFNGQTLAQKWLNLKVVNNKDKFNIFNTIIRYVFFVSIYFIIPLGIIYLMFNFIKYDNIYSSSFVMVVCSIILLFYLIVFIKYFFTKKIMLYEKLSKTKLVSTIKVEYDSLKEEKTQK